MIPLSQALREVLAFDERKTVDSAVAASTEYAKPITEWTTFGPPIEVHEHGFYSGARFERDRLEPLHKALCEAVEALERYAHLHIANDERNASSAPSNQYSPAAEALARLRELVGK